MSRSRLQTAFLFAALAAAGALAWSLRLSSRLEVDVGPLATLPSAFGSWAAIDIPLEDGVAAMLRADAHVQRAYQDALGDYVWLYVGYYGTARGGRPEHTPWVCYPSTGWEIESADEMAVDLTTGLRANRLIVESEGDRRLVLFWYRSEERTGITGSVGLTLSHLRQRLLRGRADGALVRISTQIDGDEIAAQSRLANFASAIDRQLAGHWPSEKPR